MPIAAVVAAPSRQAEASAAVAPTPTRRSAICACCGRHRLSVVRKLRSALQDTCAPGRARSLVQQLVQPLHLSDERGDVVALRRSSALRRPAPAASAGCSISVADGVARAPPRRAFGTISASWRSVRTSSRPSASVATIGFPIASASNDRQRRAFPQRRKHHDVERRQRRGDVAHEAAEHEPIAEAERAAPAPRARRCSSPSPTMKTRTSGCFARISGAASTRYSIALRRHQPRDGADGDRAGRDAERLPRRRDLVRAARPRELVERRAEVDDLGPLGRHQPRARRELAGRFRHRDREVGVRRQQAIGDLLEPRRVAVVGVLVQNRRNAHPPRAQPAERRRAVAVQVHDVGALLAQHLAAAPGRCAGSNLCRAR